MSPPTAADSNLGKDFWLFQIGQMISIVGDSCGNIALAWWILDATGSPGKMASVLAPSMLIQSLLTPLAGPLGDRHTRKWLIVGADLLRAAVLVILTICATRQFFSLPLVIGSFLIFGAGSALFNASSMSIVPQLVASELISGAVRQSQALQAVGRVMGGVAGGILVSWGGVGPAFAVDSLSFGLAALATAAIGRSTAPPKRAGTRLEGRHPLAAFVGELKAGFRVVYRVRVLFRLCVAAVLFNLVLSPMQVILPTFVKQVRGMPAWFLGGLEAAVGLGIILGAMGIGRLEQHLPRVPPILAGLLLLGGGTVLLPYAPGTTLPMLVMLFGGMGAAWTQIPIGVRISLATPDHFRARISSIFAFIFAISAPLGIGLAGVLLALLGTTFTLTFLGGLVLLLVPAVLRIPEFREFFSRSPTLMDGYFVETNPRAFEED